MPESSELGRLLASYRLAAGLSQEQLARRAGRHKPSTISDIERGLSRSPRPATLKALADALALTPQERKALLRAAVMATPVDDASVPARTDDPAPTLADALVRHRTRAGLTPRALADASGLTVKTIGNIESGRTPRVRPDTARLLADALALDGDDRRHFLALALGGSVPVSAARAVALPATLHGRVEDYAMLSALVRNTRLVTVTGPGGIGKTALATATVDALDAPVSRFHFADFAAGTDTATAMATLSDLDGADEKALLDAVADTLPARGVMFLDNLEHLRGAARCVAEVLRRRGDITVIATSRSALGLAEERVLPLQPLDLLAACSVFRDAADLAGRPVSGGPEQQETVRRICARLDRLPLAIHLAASWSRLMSPDELLSHLDQPDHVLRAPGGLTSDRHATIAATVAWSLRLTPAHARAVFQTMSAAPGPWTLDLLEAVHDDPRVLDGLHELVAAQLVTVDSDDGVSRFAMLQPIRDAGRADLAADPDKLADILDRHSRYLLTAAEIATIGLTGTDQARWLRRTDRIYPHYESALRHLTDQHHPQAVRLAAGLWRYWQMRGRYRTGLTAIRAAIASVSASGDIDPAALATAHYGSAVLSHLIGENPAARSDGQRALDLYQGHHDVHGVGSVLSLLGMISLHTGEPHDALACYERGLRATSWESTPRAYTTLQANVAPVYAVLGNLPKAVAAAEEATVRYQILGDSRGVAAQLGNLAGWSARQGDTERARDLLNEASQLFARLDDPAGRAEVHLVEAELALDDGDTETARVALDLARPLALAMEDSWALALVTAYEAEILLFAGDSRGAQHGARSAAVRAESLGYQPAFVRAALVQAVSAAQLHDPTAALRHAHAGLLRCRDLDARATVSLAHVVATVHPSHPAGRRLGNLVATLSQRPGCAIRASALLLDQDGVGNAADLPDSDLQDSDLQDSEMGVIEVRDEAIDCVASALGGTPARQP